MGLSVQIHPDTYDVRLFPAEGGNPAFAVVKTFEGDGSVSLFMSSLIECDALIETAREAKRLLLGEQPSRCTAETDLDGEALYCDREPGHDGGHHAAGLDEGSEIAWSDSCDERWPGGLGFVCTLYAGHAGPHEAWGTDEDEPLQVWVTPRDLEDGA